MDITSVLNMAAYHIEAGRFAEAEKLYREILIAKPEEANALYGLGCVAFMARAYDDAIRLISTAVKKVPRAANWHLALGDAYRYAGNISEALRSYEKAAKLSPENVTILNNLGAAYQETGDIKHAVMAFRRTVDIAPKDPQYLTNLGAALQKMERNYEALAYFDKALNADPTWAPAWLDKGAALLALSQFENAIAPLKRAVALMPDAQEPRDNLAVALSRSDRRSEAIALLEESLTRNPTPLTYQSLIKAFNLENRPTAAEERAREGIVRFPNQASLYISLALSLVGQGRVTEGLHAYRESLKLNLHVEDSNGGLAFYLNAVSILPIEQRAAAESSARALAAKPIRPRPLPPRESIRRLRVGYVSPDFRKHSVAYFLQGLLATHNRERVHIFCYSAATVRDEMTDRLNALSEEWREISLLSDDQAARLIVQDKIDILVDLAGYTNGHRLGVFALRPAPVQVTYMGYPSTTGLDAINYRITDAIADPPGMTEAWYTEKLIRLPRTFLAYTPAAAPDISALPCAQGRPFTFGSFNAIHKLSDQTLDMWAMLLSALPDSRLLLKTASFSDHEVKARFLELFSERGIDARRIELRGFEKENLSHLEMYGDIDIALDTFPYNGTTTTCEALYMGVPVITLTGSVHASRVSASLLHAVGLDFFIAESLDEVVHIGTQMAHDISGLSELRQTLRERMRHSSLMDGHDLAAALEIAFREMWAKACSD